MSEETLKVNLNFLNLPRITIDNCSNKLETVVLTLKRKPFCEDLIEKRLA